MSTSMRHSPPNIYILDPKYSQNYKFLIGKDFLLGAVNNGAEDYIHGTVTVNALKV
jgi:hypothetical protein